MDDRPVDNLVQPKPKGPNPVAYYGLIRQNWRRSAGLTRQLQTPSTEEK